MTLRELLTYYIDNNFYINQLVQLHEFLFLKQKAFRIKSLMSILSIIQQIMKNDVIHQDEIIIEKIQNPNQEIRYRKYIKMQLIGRGGFANCYQGLNLENNQRVAVKIIEKNTLSRNRAKQKLLSQIKIHKILNHPNIVKFISVFQDLKRVFIIVELCQNRALSDLVRKRKRLSVMEVKKYMHQLVQAIQYLHSVKVIHRDLKMANIFLDSQLNLKIGDLGLAAKLEYQEQRKRTMCGTPNYIAPQIIMGATGHSYEVDIWSAGVICYAMLFGRPPFQSSQISKTYEKIKMAYFQFPAVDGITNQAKDFITKILKVDPKKRMTIQEMKGHPFLSEKVTPLIQNRQSMAKTLLPQCQGGNLFDDDKINKSKQPTASSIKAEQKQPETQNCGKITAPLKWESASVLCYVDYSSKYGLGYILSNGSYAVYFNDSSLLYQTFKQKSFHYISDPSLSETNITKYQPTEIQSVAHLYKKHALFKKFKVYLDDQLLKIKENVVFGQGNGQIYIKQWLKTKHAIMFRLNNKIFQVNFFDGSEVSLKTDEKLVLIKTKKGEIKIMLLQDAMAEKDSETSRRIKYIRQILHKIKEK